ncbi:hypothetical protein FACS189485_01770 [Spirochaetia bacterium]|nr:hypothetical protein FACS189485_01770 [Spirochaetia bacterium]
MPDATIKSPGWQAGVRRDKKTDSRDKLNIARDVRESQAPDESAAMENHRVLFRQVAETLKNTLWTKLDFFESTVVNILAESVKPYILHDGTSWLVYNETTGIFENDPHTVYRLAGFVATVWHDELGLGATGSQFNFLKYIDSDKGHRAVMNGLSNIQGIYCKPTEFDTDPYMLNCQGEAYDLRNGSHRPSNPTDRFTQTTNYRPAAGPTPIWDKFLDDFTCGDQQLKRYLLRFFGQGLTGLMLQRQFLYWHGEGSNGKDKMLEAVGAIMGSYYGTANPELFSKQDKYGKDAQYFYSLVGKRLVTCSDVPDGTLNLPAIKQITGNSPITIKKLYADEINGVYLKCKLIMSSNFNLRLTEFSRAVSTRLRLIQCNQVLTDETKDTHIVEKVLTEAPAILDALIKEAVAFCRDDRELPCGAIRKESEKYQESQDVLGSFLKDAFEFRSKISTAELFRLYKDGVYGKLGKGRFFIEVDQRGYKKTHTEKGDFFINPEDDNPEADKNSSDSRNSLYTRDIEKLRPNDEFLSADPEDEPPF